MNMCISQFSCMYLNKALEICEISKWWMERKFVASIKSE